MSVEKKRKVGAEIKSNKLTLSSRPSEQEENNFNNRGGGRLVKSGLITEHLSSAPEWASRTFHSKVQKGSQSQ